MVIHRRFLSISQRYQEVVIVRMPGAESQLTLIFDIKIQPKRTSSSCLSFPEVVIDNLTAALRRQEYYPVC